jgi:hypothetical protein
MDMLVKAKRRMEMQERDQTEYFDDQLIEAPSAHSEFDRPR